MRNRDADLRLTEEALTRWIDVNRRSFSIDDHHSVGHPGDHGLRATHFAIDRLPQRLLDAPHRVAAESDDDDAHDDHHQGQALAEAGDLFEIDILLTATLIGQRIGEIRSRSLQPSGFEQVDLAPVRVTFRDLRDDEIETYLRAEQPYDCAGSARSEGLGIALLEAIDNDDPSALVGLPLIRTCRMLRAAGVPLP